MNWLTAIWLLLRTRYECWRIKRRLPPVWRRVAEADARRLQEEHPDLPLDYLRCLVFGEIAERRAMWARLGGAHG